MTRRSTSPRHINEKSRRLSAILVVGLGIALAVVAGLLGFIGAAAALGFPVFLVVLLRPDLALLGLASGITLEGVFLLGGMSIPKILGLLAVGGWVLQKLLRGESWSHLIHERAFQLASVFVIWAALSMLWSRYNVGLGALITLAQLVALAVVIADLGRDWRFLDLLAKALIVGGLVATVWTLQQYFGGGLRRAGEEIVAGSVNSTARILVTLLPFGFYLIRSPAHGLVWRVMGLAYLLVAPLGVAVTFSRTSYLLLPLVALPGLALLLRTRTRRGFGILIVSLVGLMSTALPWDRIIARADTMMPYLEQSVASTEGPMSGRGYHYRIGYEIFSEHPLIGVGYGNYGYYFLEYQHIVPGADRFYRSPRSAHSAVTSILSELGLVGMAIAMVFLFLVLRYLESAWRQTRSSPESRAAAFVDALAMAVLVQIPYALMGSVYQDKLFWVLIGCVIVAERLVRRGRARRRARSRLSRTVTHAVPASRSAGRHAPVTP